MIIDCIERNDFKSAYSLVTIQQKLTNKKNRDMISMPLQRQLLYLKSKLKKEIDLLNMKKSNLKIEKWHLKEDILNRTNDYKKIDFQVVKKTIEISRLERNRKKLIPYNRFQRNTK